MQRKDSRAGASDDGSEVVKSAIRAREAKCERLQSSLRKAEGLSEEAVTVSDDAQVLDARTTDYANLAGKRTNDERASQAGNWTMAFNPFNLFGQGNANGFQDNTGDHRNESLPHIPIREARGDDLLSKVENMSKQIQGMQDQIAQMMKKEDHETQMKGLVKKLEKDHETQMKDLTARLKKNKREVQTSVFEMLNQDQDEKDVSVRAFSLCPVLHVANDCILMKHLMVTYIALPQRV